MRVCFLYNPSEHLLALINLILVSLFPTEWHKSGITESIEHIYVLALSKILRDKQNLRALKFSLVLVAILSEGYWNLSCTIFQSLHETQLHFTELFKGFCMNYSEPQKLSQITDWSSLRDPGNITGELSSKKFCSEDCFIWCRSQSWCREERAEWELAIGVLQGSETACSGLCHSLCLTLQETFVLWVNQLLHIWFLKMTKKGIDTWGNPEIQLMKPTVCLQNEKIDACWTEHWKDGKAIG